MPTQLRCDDPPGATTLIVEGYLDAGTFGAHSRNGDWPQIVFRVRHAAHAHHPHSQRHPRDESSHRHLPARGKA